MRLNHVVLLLRNSATTKFGMLPRGGDPSAASSFRRGWNLPGLKLALPLVRRFREKPPI